MQRRTRLRVSSPAAASKFTRAHEPIHPHLRVNSPILASIFTRTREILHPHSRVYLSEVTNKRFL